MPPGPAPVVGFPARSLTRPHEGQYCGSMSTLTPILLLQGDAEARLLADAQPAIESVLPDRQVQLLRAWITRPDWLDAEAPGPPETLRRRGLVENLDVRVLLEQPHRLVIISFLPVAAMPALKHRDGGVFLAHQGLREHWSPEDAALVHAECEPQPALSPHEAALAFEPIIDRLQQRGAAVAIVTAFRHVREPLRHQASVGLPPLRELIRRANLEVARLSQRTGCFVLDLDRPLAQEGGDPLATDCFGGTGQAAELAMEELVALVMDALPDELMPAEVP
jgi:hypothetical protein